MEHSQQAHSQQPHKQSPLAELSIQPLREISPADTTMAQTLQCFAADNTAGQRTCSCCRGAAALLPQWGLTVPGSFAELRANGCSVPALVHIAVRTLGLPAVTLMVGLPEQLLRALFAPASRLQVWTQVHLSITSAHLTVVKRFYFLNLKPNRCRALLWAEPMQSLFKHLCLSVTIWHC